MTVWAERLKWLVVRVSEWACQWEIVCVSQWFKNSDWLIDFYLWFTTFIFVINKPVFVLEDILVLLWFLRISWWQQSFKVKWQPLFEVWGWLLQLSNQCCFSFWIWECGVAMVSESGSGEQTARRWEPDHTKHKFCSREGENGEAGNSGGHICTFCMTAPRGRLVLLSWQNLEGCLFWGLTTATMQRWRVWGQAIKVASWKRQTRGLVS